MRGVMLISDRKARLKPCLRCGYSLCHIAGARNCPECGLAVRISLSDNRALEWSNPAWLRGLAWACVLLAVAVLLLIGWRQLDAFVFGDEFELFSEAWRRILYSSLRALIYVQAVAYVAGAFLLSREERRYPDRDRILRRMVPWAVLLAALVTVIANDGWIYRSRLFRVVPVYVFNHVMRVVDAPWIPAVGYLVICLYLIALERRAGAVWLRRAITCALMVGCIAQVTYLFAVSPGAWDVFEVAWFWCAQLAMVVVLVTAAVILRRRAREAEANWISD